MTPTYLSHKALMLHIITHIICYNVYVRKHILRREKFSIILIERSNNQLDCTSGWITLPVSRISTEKTEAYSDIYSLNKLNSPCQSHWVRRIKDRVQILGSKFEGSVLGSKKWRTSREMHSDLFCIKDYILNQRKNDLILKVSLESHIIQIKFIVIRTKKWMKPNKAELNGNRNRLMFRLTAWMKLNGISITEENEK